MRVVNEGEIEDGLHGSYTVQEEGKGMGGLWVLGLASCGKPFDYTNFWTLIAPATFAIELPFLLDPLERCASVPIAPYCDLFSRQDIASSK